MRFLQRQWVCFCSVAPYHMATDRILPVLTALLLLFAWGGATAATEVGTVLVSDLNMRSGPGREHGVVLRLARDTQVRVLGREAGWLKIDHRGRKGYILYDARYVRLTTFAGPKAPEVTDTRSGPGPEELKRLRKKAETLHEKLKTSQTQLGAMSDQERALMDEVNAAEKALDHARRQVRATRAVLEDLDQRIKTIQQESAALEKAIRDGEAHAAQRLVALYKLHQVGRIHLLASADSFFDFINRKAALERILARDDELLQQLRNDRARLEALLEKITVSKAEQRELNAALQPRIHLLDAEQKHRTALLDNIRNAQELEQAAFKALNQAARELDAAMQAIGPGSAPDRTGTRAAVRPSGGSFEENKGLLNWPVRGKIVSFFGPYRDENSNLVNFQSGINIQAERGEPIRAVGDGYVIYSSWFKGFGNMIIIDHGVHYYTVYAHLEEVFKVKGDRVENGEVIATVGDTGSLRGPGLHFQVRHHGTPVDPLQWLDKG